MLSDEDILKLYQDPTFGGSFSGVKNLKHFLKTDLNEDVSEQRLYNVLNTLPNYIYQLKPIRKFPTRNYVVDGFGQLMGKHFFSFKIMLNLVVNAIDIAFKFHTLPTIF
jgi:hypothetical protein